MIPARIAHLAGLGAFAASAGLALLFILLGYASRHTLTGGMRWDLAWVTWISLGTLFAAIIVAHLYLGKELVRLGRGGGPTEL